MIEDAKYTEQGSIVAKIDGFEMTVPNDMENRHRAVLAEWEAAGNVIEPYLEPEPTPEELRVLMPPLSRRQFWLAADKIGVSKADVLSAANDNQLRIEIEESTEFHRTYESVVLLAPMLGITPEQLDDIWLWASAA